MMLEYFFIDYEKLYKINLFYISELIFIIFFIKIILVHRHFKKKN